MPSESSCDRCGRKAVGERGSPDAKIFRRAERGHCAECHVVTIIQTLSNMHGAGTLPTGERLRESLRLPHVQQQFYALMRAGSADAVPSEIDWDRVIEVWDIAPPMGGGLF